MNDDLPEMFERVQPRRAPAELRVAVLAAVERELARPGKPRWERAFELAAAACFLVGVGLTAWQANSDNPWQRMAAESAAGSGAGYAGRAEFGDERLADFVNKRLAQRPAARASFAEDYQKLLQEIAEASAG
jgi:hypothetical protein